MRFILENPLSHTAVFIGRREHSWTIFRMCQRSFCQTKVTSYRHVVLIVATDEGSADVILVGTVTGNVAIYV